MSAQTKQILYSPVDIDDADFENINATPTEEEIEFDKFRAEMQDSADYAKYTVSQQPTDQKGRAIGRKLMQMFECGIDEYTFSQLIARIRDDYGTGIYKIQARNADGTFRFSQSIGIKAPNDDNEKPDDGSSASNLISSMSRAMAEQQDRFERMVNSGPSVDPIEQMTKMMAGMGAMMTAMGLGAQNQQPIVPPKTTLEALMEMKMIKEVIGDLSGGDGDGKVDNFWGAIASAAQSFGGPLVQALALAQQNGELNADGVIALPSPTATDGVNTEIKEPPTMNIEEMKQQLNFLLTQAKNDIPPEQAVDFVIGILPDDDDALNTMESFLQQDDCLDRCIVVVPEIKEYLEWFVGWRRGMLAALNAMFDEPLTGDSELAEDANSDAGEALEPSDNDATTDGESARDANGDSERSGGD